MPDGTVTAGNASGVNDRACALLLASEAAARQHGLTPKARIIGTATAGVAPRVMGIGPAPATQKLLQQLGMTLELSTASAVALVASRLFAQFIAHIQTNRTNLNILIIKVTYSLNGSV